MSTNNGPRLLTKLVQRVKEQSSDGGNRKLEPCCEQANRPRTPSTLRSRVFNTRLASRYPEGFLLGNQHICREILVLYRKRTG